MIAKKQKRYIEEFLGDCAPGGQLMTEGLEAPLCSVNNGGAGIAFALYQLHRNSGDPGLLSLASDWIQLTVGSLDEPEAFWSEALDMSEATLGRNSLLHTETGVRCVEALIARALEDGPAHREAVEEYLRVSSVLGEMDEFSLGNGGVLFGCGLLMGGLDGDLRQKLRARGEAVYRHIAKDRTPGEGPRKRFGAAHGTAGVLYCLLKWHENTGAPVPAELTIALQKLARLGKKAEAGMRWPLEKANRNSWPGWCNGSAGFVFLWTLAAKLLGSSDYLAVARATGEYTWQNRISVPCLCCGSAGQAYAFLNLYRATGDSMWLTRAREEAEPAMEMDGYSLFRGKAGVALLLSDLDQPETARMPMFE
jgi:serine/threonine-protein kinase